MWRLSTVHDHAIEFTQRVRTFFFILLFLVLLFLLLFLLFPLALNDRCYYMALAQLSLYHAHAGAVKNLQRFDNRLKMSVQRNVLLDSTGLQRAMFLGLIRSSS